MMRASREAYPAKMVTAGVDIQKDHCVYSVRGWPANPVRRIVNELHEARQALADARPEIDSLIAGLYRSHVNPSDGIVHDEDVAHEIAQLTELHERIVRLITEHEPQSSGIDDLLDEMSADIDSMSDEEIRTESSLGDEERMRRAIDTATEHPTPEQSRRQRASEIEKDEAAVDRFAKAMKEKLAKAREKGRGGWDDPGQCPAERLAAMLIEHLRKGNEGTFEDVANFAMMLHQRGEAPETLARAWLAADKEASDRGYRYAMKAAAPRPPEQTGDALAALDRLLLKAGKEPCSEEYGVVRRHLTTSGVPEEVRRLPEKMRTMASGFEHEKSTRWLMAQAAQLRYDADMTERALAAVPTVPESRGLEFGATRDCQVFVGYSNRDEEGGFTVLAWAPDWITTLTTPVQRKAAAASDGGE